MPPCLQEVDIVTLSGKKEELEQKKIILEQGRKIWTWKLLLYWNYT